MTPRRMDNSKFTGTQPAALQALSAAHLLIHAEVGPLNRQGGSALEAALHRLQARYRRRPQPTSAALQLQVDNLQGLRMSAVADAGSLTDLPLPPGTYHVTALLGVYRRCYTMTLEPGTSFHLHLRFSNTGH